MNRLKNSNGRNSRKWNDPLQEFFLQEFQLTRGREFDTRSQERSKRMKAEFTKAKFADFLLTSAIKCAWLGSLTLGPGEMKQLEAELLESLLELTENIPPDKVLRMAKVLPDVLLRVRARLAVEKEQVR